MTKGRMNLISNRIPLLIGLGCLVAVSGCVSHRSRQSSQLPIVPQIIPPPQPVSWNPPVWWNGTTGTTCLVHHVPRIPEKVPIAYGLLTGDPAYEKAQDNLFPNTWYYTVGGCCVDVSFPKTEIIRYCPECRRLSKEWIECHKNQSNLDKTGCDQYVVRKSDTLYSISRRFKDRDTFEEIVERNGIQDVDKLTVGRTLYIKHQ